MNTATKQTIRDCWRPWRNTALRHMRGLHGAVYRVPIYRPASVFNLKDFANADRIEEVPSLTFTLELGGDENGNPVYHVTCNGLVVEQGPRKDLPRA